MHARLRHRQRPIADFKALLDCYSPHEFRKPTRSTVPLLSYWKSAGHRAEEFLRQICQPADGDILLSFEHDVPSLPRAKASFTDLAILTESTAVAIEAKWTEGMYDSVGRWILKGEYPDSRRKVVDHWLKLIQPYSGRVLSHQGLENSQVVYQSLHRTASACAMATERSSKAVVVYQVFDEGKRHPDYEGRLRELAGILQPTERLEFHLQIVTMSLTPAIESLRRFCDSRPECAHQYVREALLRDELFEFHPSTMSLIEGGLGLGI